MTRSEADEIRKGTGRRVPMHTLQRTLDGFIQSDRDQSEAQE